ncbi:MAG: leucine-rich repeat domain-containing protein [Muribaculaceae bacterium]|nr:leucine-rich repeat domain-containing protein [Muribaculaceae bacterium]
MNLQYQEYVSLDNIKFTFESNGGVLTRITTTLIPEQYTFYSTSLIIPEGIITIGEDICDRLPERIGFNSIIFPKSLRHIGHRAFRNRINGMRSIRFPARLLSIGDEAFALSGEWGQTSSVTLLNIPSEVQSIGKRAFEKWTSLKTLRTGKNLTEIGTAAFAYCNKVLNWEGPQFTGKMLITAGCVKAVFGEAEIIHIPEGVTGVDTLAFSSSYCYTSPGPWSYNKYRGAIRITLPDSLTEIGDRALYGSRIQELEIPVSVASIGINPIAGTPCTRVTGKFSFADTMLIDGPTLVGTVRQAVNPHIPKGITHIGDYAFLGNSSERIIIPEGIVSIGNYAFAGCPNLMSVKLPDTLVHIGNEAFSNCAHLRNLVIPPSANKSNK